MNIDVIISLNRLSEKCNGMTCFEAPEYVSKEIRHAKLTQGVVIIDNVPVKFSFSPLGMDGDIFGGTDTQRLIIKYIVPLYVYNNLKKS